MITRARSAATDDLDAIVSLTRSQRHQLAEWSPVYFNPRAGADEGHANYLRFIVGSGDHQTLVLEDDGEVFGFFVHVAQHRHLWVDDLCVNDTQRWPEAIRLVFETSTAPWVTCVAVADEHRRTAMAKARLREISTYYRRATKGITPRSATSPPDIGPSRGQVPAHTFGGRPFSADLPGALVVVDGDGGYAIGSPSATPPIYDPGGSACVVDQVVGADRERLTHDVIATAAGRGDAQVVVVCDRDDQELAGIIEAAGFTAEVLLIGSRPRQPTAHAEPAHWPGPTARQRDHRR